MTGCRPRLQANDVYLIFGIPHFVNATHYYNTGLVIAPSGEKVYRQAKLAIAWALDGMPGRWRDSPWAVLPFKRSSLCFIRVSP